MLGNFSNGYRAEESSREIQVYQCQLFTSGEIGEASEKSEQEEDQIISEAAAAGINQQDTSSMEINPTPRQPLVIDIEKVKSAKSNAKKYFQHSD